MYIIKKHYEATESNKNFANETHDWYFGKGHTTLSEMNEFPTEWMIKEYGYKTIASAQSGMKTAKRLADWEAGHGNWNIIVELVKVD